MTTQSNSRLLPRNVAALRAFQDPSAPVRIVAGNSHSTRLESGIGNFFPGLECDLRNLERRFFPFLEVDPNYDTNEVFVASVDVQRASDAGVAPEKLRAYETIFSDLANGTLWLIESISGDFGPLDLRLSDLDGDSFGAGRRPPDAWTAIRLLKEGSDVALSLARKNGPAASLTLSGERTRYIADNGAFARIFEPGELTQSLCSPWTHDFRDCACYYWASNHPDVALPPLPAAMDDPTDPRWGLDTAWERQNRSLTAPPVATAAGADENGSGAVIRELAHHEINRDWQLLNFVAERREQTISYTPAKARSVAPLPDDAALIKALRYAAGVELAVALEYLSAAWSLRTPDRLAGTLRDDVRAAFEELRRVAVSEMLHLRAVNDILFQLSGSTPFSPALGVATQVPFGKGGARAHQFLSALPSTIDAFIEIEAPSESVDGVYAPIFATFDARPGFERQAQEVRTIISEGGDHFQTFKFIKEWLGRHAPESYLISPASTPPPQGDSAHLALQQRYRSLLDLLYRGYQLGLPAGAVTVNAARSAMLGTPGSIEEDMCAVAAKGFLPVFDAVTDDPRFAPVSPP